MVLEKTLESPLDCKEIQPVHPKGDQFWVFFGRTDAEAETPVLWPPHAKSRLIGKDPDAGRDWGQEEKGTTEDEGSEEHTSELQSPLNLVCRLLLEKKKKKGRRSGEEKTISGDWCGRVESDVH